MASMLMEANGPIFTKMQKKELGSFLRQHKHVYLITEVRYTCHKDHDYYGAFYTLYDNARDALGAVDMALAPWHTEIKRTRNKVVATYEGAGGNTWYYVVLATRLK